jgi:hypothetical protein
MTRRIRRAVRRWLRRLGLGALAGYVAACTPPAVEPRPPVLESTDAGESDAADQPDSLCGRACGALARCGCAESRPTPKGEPCWSVCSNAIHVGEQIGVELLSGLGCVLAAPEGMCASLRSCGVCTP